MKRFPLIFMAMALAARPSSGADIIRFKGSDTLGAKLVPQLCEGYRKLHPDVAFDIAAEGSSTAFQALRMHTADIGMTSRDIKLEETAQFEKAGIKLEQRIAAHDVWAIVVNCSNPVDGLSSKQVEAIFTGDARNWREVGGQDVPIQVYTRNTSSGSYSAFRDLAMQGRAYAESSSSMYTVGIPQLVAESAGGIGYVGLAYSRAKRLKVLKIDGEALPGQAPASYSYVRPCFYFIRHDASAAVRAFLDWATQAVKARETIAAVGFLPPV